MYYSIWLEFELLEEANESIEESSNMIITYEDGREEGYNVWTIKLFQEMLRNNELEREVMWNIEEVGYSTSLPDLIVTRLDRNHITEVVKKMLGH